MLTCQQISALSSSSHTPEFGDNRSNAVRLTWDSMHPDLALHKHPHCAETIKMFEACHAENKWKKFLGVCNDARLQLDQCLGEEVCVCVFNPASSIIHST